MKRLGIKRSFGIVIMMAIVSVTAIYGVRTVYATINNDLPAAADMEAGGKTGYIELHLKKLDVAQVVKNKMSAYYPSWDTAANGKSIKITSGSMGRVCNVDEPKVSGNIEIYIKIADNDRTYNIPIDRVCDTDDFYSNTFDFPNGTLFNDGGIDKTRADITVSYKVSPQLPANSGSDLNYEMHLTGNNNGNGLLALRSNDAADEFGLRSSYTNNPGAANNNNVRFSVPFGFPCSTDFPSGDPTNRQVKLYDADGVFGDTYMWVERNDQKLDFNEYGTSMQLIQGWEGANKRWKLNGSNTTFNMLTLARDFIERGEKYALVVNNNGNGGSLNPHYNTLSVGTPQDSIYARGNCKYNLKPEINIDSSSHVYYPNVLVTGSVYDAEDPDGPIPEAHPWEIYAVRYPSEPSTRDLTNGNVANGNPCSNGVLPNGSYGCTQISPPLNYTAQSSYSVNRFTGGGPDPVGTRVCFFARVQNPTHLIPDDSDWVYSDMRCSVSLKKPRVQFRGSDVRVGGNAISSYYNTKDNTGTFSNYGSWAEYGMFTSGINTLVSSGNSLRNGNTDNSVAAWNRLTFANTTSPYGSYGVVPTPSSAYTYFSGLPGGGTSLNAATIPNGVYDVGTSIGNTLARLPESRGAGVILRSNGDFRIDRDIIVNNSNLNNARDITQVVIIANNITIDDSVTQVDAWLITPPTGSINTCRSNGTLDSGMCNQTLTVNGPIYTNRLMLRRTAGANPPTAADLSSPAEKFNLRPDAILWSYTYGNKADYAQTDFVQELPPRY